jgi:hypothetical protein
LVYKMLEAQYKAKEGSHIFYPEAQFVQYLLPCFVASYLDLCKSKVNAKDCQEYLNLIHQLVKSYEDFEYFQKYENKDTKPWVFSETVQRNLLFVKILGLCKSVYDTYMDPIQNAEFFLFYIKGVKFMTSFNSQIYPQPSEQESPSSSWKFRLFTFASRLRKALEKVGKYDGSQFETVIFTANICSETYCNDGDEQLEQMWNLLNYHLKKLIKDLDADFSLCFETEKPPELLLKDSLSLPYPKIFGIALFLFLQTLDEKKLKGAVDEAQGPGFMLDLTDVAYWTLYNGDIWKLKQQMSSEIKAGNGFDPTLVTLEFAKGNLCYDFVLKTLTPEKKVKMSKPGEITFCPIQHCRWCGLADASSFRLCPECKDDAYPDVNFFCSELCENEALENQHTEEHAQYLMTKCGIGC